LPALAAQPVTIPVGTRAQSIPDPNQDPQTFETIAPAAARVEWNAIPAQQSEPVRIRSGHGELYIAGTTTQLAAGDGIVVVGVDREQDSTSKLWDVCWIERVEIDLAHQLTHIVLSGPLKGAWDPDDPGPQGIKVHAFRQRAALFGHNAPDANLLVNANNGSLFTNAQPPTEWKGFAIDATGKKIDLDAAYPKIVAGSWFALAGDNGKDPWQVELYRVTGVAELSRSSFGLSGKTTRLTSDGTENLDKFGLRQTQVLAQSEELTLVERPLTYPVYGAILALDELQPLLAPEQLIAISGKRQRVVIGGSTTGAKAAARRILHHAIAADGRGQQRYGAGAAGTIGPCKEVAAGSVVASRRSRRRRHRHQGASQCNEAAARVERRRGRQRSHRDCPWRALRTERPRPHHAHIERAAGLLL